MTGQTVDDEYGISTGYTYGYHRQLSPTWLQFVAKARGLTIPSDDTFRYFELGFGQGVSLNVHAASNLGEYWGNDYNPEHVDFARSMAEASGANIHLLEDSFEQLAERSDLPQFHVVVAHGIWSWISDEPRSAILKFLSERLAPGGIFYISYNALPGSASGIATQRFLHLVSKTFGDSLSESERFDHARDLLGPLKDDKGSHFDHYPRAKQRLANLLASEPAYYLHEYAVGAWRPQLLLEVSAQLGEIGLEFFGSADLNSKDIEIPKVSSEGEAAVLNETLRDFKIDCQFRSDLFVRSPFSQTRGCYSRILDDEVAVTCVPDNVEASPSDLNAQIDSGAIRAALDLIQKSSLRMGSIFELIRLCQPALGTTRAQDAIIYLLNQGLVQPTNTIKNERIFEACHKINSFLSHKLLHKAGHQLRVSTKTGSAIEFPSIGSSIHKSILDPRQVIDQLNSERSEPTSVSALDIVKYAAHHNSWAKLTDALGIV